MSITPPWMAASMKLEKAEDFIAHNVPVVCDVPARLISKPLGLRRAGMWWSEAWEP